MSKWTGLRRLSYNSRGRVGGAGAAAAAAHEELITLASNAGATALYDPDNPDTWTLRDDGTDLWYSAISDALGNREDMVQGTASLQTKQITLSTGRKAQLADPGNHLIADFASDIAQPNTVFVVFRAVDVVETVRPINTVDVVGGQQVLGMRSGGNWEIWAGTFLTSSTAPDTNWHMGHGNFNGGSSELFLDGTSIVSGNANTNSLGGMQQDSEPIGRNAIEIGPIIVFTGLKTNAELSDIRDHLNANWPIGSA